MTRKYLNERWCVRCGRTEPTPYLKKNIKFIHGKVADLGCGNGRNTKYLIENKLSDIVYPIDMAGDYGIKIVLGEENLPFIDGHIDTFLANYVFMFLSSKERKRLINEIKRTAARGATLILELYPAKDSYAPNEQEMLKLQFEIVNGFGNDWVIVRHSKGRAVISKAIK
jgi:SAM-dependent methyltransferase